MVALLLEFGADANERAAWVRECDGSSLVHLPLAANSLNRGGDVAGMVLAAASRVQVRPRASDLAAAGPRGEVGCHRQGQSACSRSRVHHPLLDEPALLCSRSGRRSSGRRALAKLRSRTESIRCVLCGVILVAPVLMKAFGDRQQLHAREKAARTEALLARTQQARDPSTPLRFESLGL